MVCFSGTILHVEPKRLIVQTWRSANWEAEAIDSVLVLTFWLDAAGGRIELNHINVPDSDFAGISHGWEKYYWTPCANIWLPLVASSIGRSAIKQFGVAQC